MLNLHAHAQVKKPSKSIRFQVAYPQGLQVGVAQKWLVAIQQSGADGIRLVLNPDQEIKLLEDQFKSKTTIHVYARINASQKLIVKGASFSLSDTAALKAWIAKLRTLKSVDPDKQPGAFGLTNEQLVKVHEQLARPYPKSTRNQPVTEILKVARAQIGIPIGADLSAKEALAEIAKVPEELEGISCGTVLAAVLRPLGLVLTISDGGKQLAIVNSRKVDEHWPVGWPIQQRPNRLAPILFKQTEVDIEGFPLNEVLQAIETKIEIPFVYDQNTMARHGIEMEKVVVNIGRTKTFYLKIIQQCLNQAKPRLSVELRADEAGQPILWISRNSK